MKDRITEFLVKENISPAEFADRIGVQRSSVSHVLNGRNYPGASFIQKMLASYKNLNPRWLLLGEGAMMDQRNAVIEPSLFSIPADVTSLKGNPQSAASVVIKNAETAAGSKDTGKMKNSFDKNETEGQAELVNQNISDMQTAISNFSGNKDIERIVLFFTDKSFTVYTPSK